MEPSKSMSCGWWNFRPLWLQRFASPGGFLWVYGLLGTTQTMAYIYFVATLTTMEKRFKIPSKTTGLMLSGNEISQILLSLLLTYYGGRGNKPRWIAWGVVISALSCFILALPHFIYGPGTEALSLTQEHIESALEQDNKQNLSSTDIIAEERYSRLCDADDNPYKNASCDTTNQSDSSDGNYSILPIFLVFLSQFVLGIGTTVYYALGQIYLDDNSRKKSSPLFFGTTFALRTLGPPLGFVLGFLCLRMYVDPTMTPLIDKTDPRWMGAWWLGWIILGFIMLFFAALISLFPRHLPPTKKMLDKQKSSTNERLLPAPLEQDKPALKEFPVALKRLLSNKILILNITSTIFYILGASAYITFSTKYIEVQYHQSAAGASMLAGTGGLLAMVVGFLASGIIISKYRPRPRLLLFWNVFAGSFYVISEFSFIFLGCPDIQLYGATNMTVGSSSTFVSDCNIGCQCPVDLHFSPVCIENITFYSPCHAGCTSITDPTNIGPNMTYSNCLCAPSLLDPYQNISVNDILAKDGICKPDCTKMFITFIIVTFIMHSIGSSAKVGNILVNLRCVDPKDKAFAQGLALFLISLFAFIPGPILFGAIIDATCLIWNESCGKKGHCILYKKYDFRFYINITAAGITCIAVLFDLAVWWLGKDLQLYEEEEDNKIEEIKTKNKIVKDSKMYS